MARKLEWKAGNGGWELALVDLAEGVQCPNRAVYMQHDEEPKVPYLWTGAPHDWTPLDYLRDVPREEQMRVVEFLVRAGEDTGEF